MRKTSVATAVALLPCAAGAFTYSEGVDGDLSGDRTAPTALVAAVGANTFAGSTAAGDLDYVRISLPGGLQLAQLVLNSVASTDDVAFIGLQSGPIFTVSPGTAHESDLLGYTHFGTGPTAGGATPGNDILDDMCAGVAAIGCTPPLTGTDYTFWIQQFNSIPFAYSFTARAGNHRIARPRPAGARGRTPGPRLTRI